VVPGSEWLCFIDADVKLAPGALSSAMHAALMQRLDLLSLAPRQELQSFAERLILPCGLIILSFLQGLRQAGAFRPRRYGDRAVHAGAARCLRGGGRARRRVHRDLRRPGIRPAG